jgi:hypothetical protein
MLCGHCGTAINPGFTTCPACGAVYRRRIGWLTDLSGFMGTVLFAAGLLPIVFDHNTEASVWLGIGCSALGALLFMLARRQKGRTPYLWYRREP